MSDQGQNPASSPATVRNDTDLATALHEELSGIIRDAKEGLVAGLPYDKYQQACGMIEAYSQVRDVLIRRTIEAIQRR